MVTQATQCQNNLTTHKINHYPEFDYYHEEVRKICGTKNIVVRKQCSKEERCNCAVIKLMFHR
jgi:hypothetical protein